MTPFYDAPDPDSAMATIRRARELGVNFLDTADGYGRGQNEELIAQAIAGHREDYVIASKFGNLGLLGDPRFADGRPEYVREACEKSLTHCEPTSSTFTTSTASTRPCRSRTPSVPWPS
jgi:aryl-alcohol dehydrogenase-like predicted oxidoreductase